MRDQFGAPIAPEVSVGGLTIRTDAAPSALRVHADLGIVSARGLTGQVIHRARWPERGLFETRAITTPGGDYLLMFPDGGHYGPSDRKVNDMFAYRSSDKGRTWVGPTVAFDIDYNQHGFVPLIPRGQHRIYAFGTQPVWGLYTRQNGLHENAPIGYRYSDDDGHTWSEVRIIRPENDPGFTGMSVMRMCETDRGTWILSAYEGDRSYRPLMTRQYLMRSEDQGRTWELLPRKRHGGWCVLEYGRMDEGRPISLGNDQVYCMMRTPTGRLWATRSEDDGRTWAPPAPTSLVHPDAPPMLFHLSDRNTLAAFHHNRHSVTRDMYRDRGFGRTPEAFMDRAELWLSLSHDKGRSWSVPRFVLANALAPTFAKAFRNHQCSYVDMFVDDGTIHLFVPHRWERVLHLQLKEPELASLPTREMLVVTQEKQE